MLKTAIFVAALWAAFYYTVSVTVVAVVGAETAYTWAQVANALQAMGH